MQCPCTNSRLSVAALRSELPFTKLVFSQILPRSRHMFSTCAVEKPSMSSMHCMVPIVFTALNHYSPSLYYDDAHFPPHVNNNFLETILGKGYSIHLPCSGKSLPILVNFFSGTAMAYFNKVDLSA